MILVLVVVIRYKHWVEWTTSYVPQVCLFCRDFHRFFGGCLRFLKLRNLARLLKSQPKNLVLLSLNCHYRDLASINSFEFPLPAA